MKRLCVSVLFGLIPSAALSAAPDYHQYDEPLVVAASPDSAEPLVLDEAPIVTPASPETDEANDYALDSAFDSIDDALYGETAPIDRADACGYPEDEHGYDIEQYGYDEADTSADFDGFYEDELSLSSDETAEDEDEYGYDEADTSADSDGFYEDELSLSSDETAEDEDEYGYDEAETSSDFDGYYEDELSLSSDETAEDEHGYDTDTELYGHGQADTSSDSDGFYEDELSLSDDATDRYEHENEYEYKYDYEREYDTDTEPYGYDEVETSFGSDGFYEDELSLSADESSAADATGDDQYDDPYDEYQYGDHDGSIADDGSGIVEPWQADADSVDIEKDVEEAQDSATHEDEYPYGDASDADAFEGSSSHEAYPYDDGHLEDASGWPSDANAERLDVGSASDGQENAGQENAEQENEVPGSFDEGNLSDEQLWQGCDAYPEVKASAHETATMIDAAWQSVRRFVASLPEQIGRLTK